MSQTKKERYESKSMKESGYVLKILKKIIEYSTHSSFEKAKDHPSVFSAISDTVSSVDLNSTPVLAERPLTLASHFVANACRSEESGSVKLYLTSKRDGLFRMASSIRSGWLVVAMVRMPALSA